MSSPLHRSVLLFWASLCLALLCPLAAPTLLAADLAINAAFAPSSTTVGVPTQFRVEIKGTTRGQPVPRIQVDGLDIQYVGSQPSNFVVNINGVESRSSSITHLYQVIPRRAGSFTVPSLTFQADGQTLQTDPVALEVTPGDNGGNGDLDTEGHAEIKLSKRSVYVGESLPVDVQFSIDGRLRYELDSVSELEGDGFTKEKKYSRRAERAQKDERTYSVESFRVTITPSRAGAISIGPGQIQYVVAVRRRTPSRSPFSLFGSLMGEPEQGVRRVAEAPAVTLEVKPLPIPGRPVDFSGAVGQYRITAEGSPKQVKIGDPITMKIAVTGVGSLDRIGAPSLADPTGWHSYPPSSRTMPDDESGMKGSKIFEQAVIPTATQSHLPIYEFSYFDPKLEKYVTLKTDATPIKVEGEALPPPPPIATGAPSNRPSPGAKPDAPLPAITDITGIKYEFGAARSVEPLYLRLGFLLAQLAPALGLGALVAARYWRPNLEGQRVSSLRRESATLRARLRQENGKNAFYSTAVRIFQIQGAIATGRPPETIDAPTVRRLFSANGSPVLDEIFETQAASLYAGAAGEDEPLSPPERERVLTAIAELERSKSLS